MKELIKTLNKYVILLIVSYLSSKNNIMSYFLAIVE